MKFWCEKKNINIINLCISKLMCLSYWQEEGRKYRCKQREEKKREELEEQQLEEKEEQEEEQEQQQEQEEEKKAPAAGQFLT